MRRAPAMVAGTRAAVALAAGLLAVAGCSVDSDDSSETAGADGGGTAAAGEAGYATEQGAASGGIAAPVAADADAVSTFGLDVDSGSYSLARAFVRDGLLPDPSTVRTEEFVNYFQQGYEPPADGIDVHIDGTTVPFLEEPGARVVRVGVQAADVDDASRPDAVLTFVIDVSGSMGEGGKLEAVKEALHALVGALRASDRVGVVVYSDDTRQVLPHTPVREADAILAAVDSLGPEGATNAEAGLRLGYDVARENAREGALNRVVLLSDGVANVGSTGPEAILATIGQATADGIDLVTVGFGLGSYRDSLMEQLADQGDGFYAYVDGPREAERLFVHDLTGTLQVVAREARVQVTFDPEQVATYRLLGYENRAIADEDFRDDSVDAGEVGAGHSVTALYEVVLREAGTSSDAPLVTATVRYLDPTDSQPVERTARVTTADLDGSLTESSPTLHLDVLVAAFAEALRGGPWVSQLSLSGVASNAAALAGRTDDPEVTEFAELVGLAAQLSG